MKPQPIDPLNPALAGLLKRNPGALEGLLWQNFKTRRAEAEVALRSFCKLLGVELSQFPRKEDIPVATWFEIGQAIARARQQAEEEGKSKR